MIQAEIDKKLEEKYEAWEQRDAVEETSHSEQW